MWWIRLDFFWWRYLEKSGQNISSASHRDKSKEGLGWLSAPKFAEFLQATSCHWEKHTFVAVLKQVIWGGGMKQSNKPWQLRWLCLVRFPFQIHLPERSRIQLDPQPYPISHCTQSIRKAQIKPKRAMEALWFLLTSRRCARFQPSPLHRPEHGRALESEGRQHGSMEGQRWTAPCLSVPQGEGPSGRLFPSPTWNRVRLTAVRFGANSSKAALAELELEC